MTKHERAPNDRMTKALRAPRLRTLVLSLTAMSDNVKTVLEVITSTTAYFTKHGVESPRLNSEHLVAHVLGKKRIELYLEFDRRFSSRSYRRCAILIRQRAQGKPLQHLLGTADFHGLFFTCDHRALVPRPETEQLVEFVEEKLKSESRTLKLLDVGTGSGVIALTLAAKIETAMVDAVDLSEEALSLARENAARLNLAERVNFFPKRLLQNVNGAYDLIVANLPISPRTRCPHCRARCCATRKWRSTGGDWRRNHRTPHRCSEKPPCPRRTPCARNRPRPGRGSHRGIDAGKLSRHSVQKHYQAFHVFFWQKYG